MDEHVVNVRPRGGVRFRSKPAGELVELQLQYVPRESLIVKVDPQWINARHKNINSKIKLGSRI